VARDIVFTCVADPDQTFLDQSARLLMSLRWFGGSVAGARFVIGCTGAVPAAASRLFDRFGAEVVHVDRYDASHGPGNKIALMGHPALAGHHVVALLDCDTLVVRDPAPWLDVDGVAAKTADIPTISQAQLAGVFRHLGLPVPAPRYTHELTGDACMRYCNSGVLVVGEAWRARLAAEWDAWNRSLFPASPEVDFPRHHLNQASLAVALETAGVPFRTLPTEMNMPVHLSEPRYPAAWHARDPVIVHYHGLAYPNGFLEPPFLRQCARRVESFNARLRAERLVPTPAAGEPARLWQRAATRTEPAPSRPKVVVGSGWWCADEAHEWTKGSPVQQSIPFFDLWYRQVIRCLDPDAVLVTDSAAPLKPDHRSYGPLEWLELDRNYGHVNDIRVGHVETKYSGFTRSVVSGATYALSCDADVYVYVEQDCLLHGERILEPALGGTTADILLGARTVNGKGIYGKVAAPMHQVSLMIVRRAGLERFIEAILGSPWTDGELSPEVIWERRMAPFDVVQIPYGRSRPIDFTRSHFYVQHLDDEELERFLELVGRELPAPRGFAYAVEPEATPEPERDAAAPTGDPDARAEIAPAWRGDA